MSETRRVASRIDNVCTCTDYLQAPRDLSGTGLAHGKRQGVARLRREMIDERQVPRSFQYESQHHKGH